MSGLIARQTIPVRVILVHPGQPRNIGTVVRAAANFGAESVCVVSPAPLTAEDEKEVRLASSRAWDVLGHIDWKPTLQQAAVGCSQLAGTTARKRNHAPPVTPRVFFRTVSSLPGITGLVFGEESSGLSSEDLNLCHSVVTIPTSPDFSSLNLAQAATALLYEAWLAQSRTQRVTSAPPDVVSREKQDSHLMQWHNKLVSRGDDPALTARKLAQLRRLIHRADASDGDLALLDQLINMR